MQGLRIILSVFLAACVSLNAWAQDECEIVLTQATDEFTAGHLTVIPDMLKDCLAKNENREWKQRANLLLAETYLLLEDPAAAEKSYLDVLWANPEFVTDETRDPIDLVYLSRKFTATPIFSFHADIGPNTSVVRVINDVRIGGEAFTKEKYTLRLGLQLGVGGDFHYNEHLSASLGVALQMTSFKHTTTDLFGQNRDIVDFIDHQTWVNIPISVKYSEASGKIRKYGYVGYATNLLIADRADVDVSNRDGSTNGGGEETLTSFDKSISNIRMKQNRTYSNGSVFLGGGLKYKYKLDYFYVDLRYSFGLRNVVSQSRRYDSVVEGLPFPYVDDDFRLDKVVVSVGYIHPLYKPRKLKKARTKSVLRSIQKGDHEKR